MFVLHAADSSSIQSAVHRWPGTPGGGRESGASKPRTRPAEQDTAPAKPEQACTATLQVQFALGKEAPSQQGDSFHI